LPVHEPEELRLRRAVAADRRSVARVHLHLVGEGHGRPGVRGPAGELARRQPGPVARARHAAARHPPDVPLADPCRRVLPGATRPGRPPSAARGWRPAAAARRRRSAALMAGEIVLGYDGQSGSVAALRTATEMAAAFGCPLIVVFGHRPAAIGG